MAGFSRPNVVIPSAIRWRRRQRQIKPSVKPEMWEVLRSSSSRRRRGRRGRQRRSRRCGRKKREEEAEIAFTPTDWVTEWRRPCWPSGWLYVVNYVYNPGELFAVLEPPVTFLNYIKVIDRCVLPQEIWEGTLRSVECNYKLPEGNDKNIPILTYIKKGLLCCFKSFFLVGNQTTP